MPLHPLKFRPRCVEKIWGGRKIETVLGKSLPAEKLIGESWELFDFPPGVVEGSRDWVSSEIVNGVHAGRSLHWAVGEFGADLYGKVPLCGNEGQFPILIKFLDAREDLSVQVHPPQKYCDDHPGAHLKSEAWYVLQNEPGSRILKGLAPGVTRGAFKNAIDRGEVEQLIGSIPVRPGDCHYLPSGTVHALGAGILVAEVQTPSDTTFRVFDFNRIEKETGKPRKLHVEQALDCIDFADAPAQKSSGNSPSSLVCCTYFNLDRIQLEKGEERVNRSAGPEVWIVAAGEGMIRAAGSEAISLRFGETVLLPAALRQLTVRATTAMTLLQVTFAS